jgi:hypothetical protein
MSIDSNTHNKVEMTDEEADLKTRAIDAIKERTSWLPQKITDGAFEGLIDKSRRHELRVVVNPDKYWDHKDWGGPFGAYYFGPTVPGGPAPTPGEVRDIKAYREHVTLDDKIHDIMYHSRRLRLFGLLDGKLPPHWWTEIHPYRCREHADSDNICVFERVFGNRKVVRRISRCKICGEWSFAKPEDYRGLEDYECDYWSDLGFILAETPTNPFVARHVFEQTDYDKVRHHVRKLMPVNVACTV